MWHHLFSAGNQRNCPSSFSIHPTFCEEAELFLSFRQPRTSDSIEWWFDSFDLLSLAERWLRRHVVVTATPAAKRNVIEFYVMSSWKFNLTSNGRHYLQSSGQDASKSNHIGDRSGVNHVSIARAPSTVSTRLLSRIVYLILWLCLVYPWHCVLAVKVRNSRGRLNEVFPITAWYNPR